MAMAGTCANQWPNNHTIASDIYIYIWDIHGKNMENLWDIYIYMENLWDIPSGNLT